MNGLVMRLGALHVGERADRPTQPLFQPQLGEGDLARRLVDFEVGERPMRDAVGFDADSFALEVHELLPLDRSVENSLRREMLLVR